MELLCRILAAAVHDAPTLNPTHLFPEDVFSLKKASLCQRHLVINHRPIAAQEPIASLDQPLVVARAVVIRALATKTLTIRTLARRAQSNAKDPLTKKHADHKIRVANNEQQTTSATLSEVPATRATRTAIEEPLTATGHNQITFDVSPGPTRAARIATAIHRLTMV